MRNYLILLFGSWAVIIIYLVFFFEDKPTEFIQGGDIQKAETIESLQQKVDSLYAENLPCQIELNRYQITLQILREEDSVAAAKFEEIMTTQTE